MSTAANYDRRARLARGSSVAIIAVATVYNGLRYGVVGVLAMVVAVVITFMIDRFVEWRLR